MKTALILVCSLIIFSISYSQETISAAGGEASGEIGIASFSVGQLVYTASNTPKGKMNQGVQHGLSQFELSNHELTSLSLRAETYPNPTKHGVVLYLEDAELENLNYSLYDIYGKYLESGKITGLTTSINLKSYQSGVYLLKVNEENVELKSFRIIKN